MLPFGRMDSVGTTRAQSMSRLLAALEGLGCEVERKGADRIEALLPSWDSSLLPQLSVLSLDRLFRDRLSISVDERGVARYRLLYWEGAQPLLHAAIAAVFAFQAWVAPAGALRPVPFIASLAAANLVPVALACAGFGWWRRRSLAGALA